MKIMNKREAFVTGILTIGIFFTVCFASFHKSSGQESMSDENFLCEGETDISRISDNGEYIFLLPKTNLELGK